LLNPLLVVAGAIALAAVILTAGGQAWIRQLSARQPGASPTARARPSTPRAPTSQPSLAPALSGHHANGLALTGLVEGGGTSYAVINGAVLQEGEQANGVTVVSIRNGSVTLRMPDGSERILRLPQ
jgi:hypothetical protein